MYVGVKTASQARARTPGLRSGVRDSRIILALREESYTLVPRRVVVRQKLVNERADAKACAQGRRGPRELSAVVPAVSG